MVKEKLENYPVLKAEIRRLELEKQRIEGEYIGVHGIGYGSIKQGSPTNKVTSSVELEFVYKETAKRELEAKINDKLIEAEIIDNALSVLTEEELKLIELRYFKKRKVNDVANVLEVNPDTVSRRIKSIINKIEPLIVV
ncbi:sigma factor-like helix-turn-helix DNA-binding protein [Cellulosilyticum sp. ST5]|uniref:sigma factor-like helix-turn-helix DNA-binding protein n=1 Tax=Cellulosilyticum sp. ST5 TaxID=3055805 RepID=UPI003977837C